jgi:PAS domain S-box-containing protein
MMVRLILANRLQMFLWWGSQFCQIYNDAAWPALGAKHPRSMGQPASECWAEIWHIIGPLIETPFSGGEATWMDDICLEMNRKGFIEETHWTIAYSPVPDDTEPSGIGGVIGTVNEITEKVVRERRVLLLRDLAVRSSEAKTAEEACAIAAETMDHHREDAPFALLYLLSDDHKHARLAGASGIATGQTENWVEIDLGAEISDEQPWPIGKVFRTEEMQMVEDLQGKIANVPPGPWSDPPRSAVVWPIRSNIAHELAGLLVLGVSSRLVFDDRYRSFCDLVAIQIATAVANAHAYEEERKCAETLAEVDRTRTAFFSNVSHEFRTPLTLMLGPIEDMLARANGSLTIQREELDQVHGNGLRLLKLVNMLLDYSRGEAGRLEASYEVVDLSSFTTDLASVFRAATENASEESFRRYFELGLIGMSITSPSKGCLEVNDEMCRILGYERSELLQKTWAEITHPDDLDADVAEFNRVMAGEIDGYTLDKRWIRKDGQVIHTIMAAQCARGPDGSVQYFVGLLLDTTERKRVEASLRRSEAILALGQRISHTGSWAWNAIDEELFCSQELLRIFGLDARTAHPNRETFFQLIHPEEQEGIRQKFDRAVEMRTHYEAEYRIIRADGALRYIEILGHPVLNEAGDLDEYVGTVMDITERRISEKKLVESERRFRLLVESIPHHVWSFRTDGTVGYCNARLTDYTGLTIEEITQGSWAALHPDDVERIRAAWDVAFSQGTKYEEEQRIRGRDGQYRRFACSAVPIQVDHGRPVEWYGTNTEVEEHRRAEESRTQLLHRLINAQEEERRRIAREMHDQFGQELSALSLELSALKHGSGEPDELGERFKALEEIATQLNADADFLVWELRPTVLDDLGLLAALTNYVKRWSKHFGIPAELHVGGMEKERLTNEFEITLYRITQEGLTNIAKHARAENVSILLERRNDHVSLIVEDDGVGFDGEQAFDTVKRGFGLLGMRERAMLVGGTFGIESAPGSGTTLIIRIPVSIVPIGEEQNG